MPRRSCFADCSDLRVRMFEQVWGCSPSKTSQNSYNPHENFCENDLEAACAEALTVFYQDSLQAIVET